MRHLLPRILRLKRTISSRSGGPCRTNADKEVTQLPILPRSNGSRWRTEACATMPSRMVAARVGARHLRALARSAALAGSNSDANPDSRSSPQLTQGCLRSPLARWAGNKHVWDPAPWQRCDASHVAEAPLRPMHVLHAYDLQESQASGRQPFRPRPRSPAGAYRQ
jgi:hypothetical protein